MQNKYNYKVPIDRPNEAIIQSQIQGYNALSEDEVQARIQGQMPQMRAQGNDATTAFEWMSGKYKTSPDTYSNMVDRQLEKTSKLADFVMGGTGEILRKQSMGEEITGTDALLDNRY